MGSYNRNSRSGGGRYRGEDSRRRDSGRREMHKAVCDECGRDCEVPFRPSGDKPIYCSECFERREGGSSQRKSRRDSGTTGFGKGDDTNRQLLKEVSSLNTKLDRIIKVLEGSAEKKPVLEKPKVKKVAKKTSSKDEAPRPAPHDIASSPPSRSKILPKQKRSHPRTTSLPRSSAKEDKKIETKKVRKKVVKKSTSKD